MFEDWIIHIDRLIRQRPHAGDALSGYRDLVIIMTETRPENPSIEMEDPIAAVKQKEGFPLFGRADLPLDFNASSQLLNAFLGHLINTERQDRAGLKKALELSTADRAWSENLFGAFLRQDQEDLKDLSAQADLELHVIRFLAQTALKPALYALRDAVAGKIDKKEWKTGYCPLCGSEPNMAWLDKTGKRHLHCGLCGEEWGYPRLSCPFCRNEEQPTLEYFMSEQEEGFRVDFCRKCSRYIKTVDRKVFEEPAPMDLEYMATLHLDILAHEQGFK